MDERRPTYDPTNTRLLCCLRVRNAGCRIGRIESFRDTTSFPPIDKETPVKNPPSPFAWTAPTLRASMDRAGRRGDKRNAAAIRRDGIMEDLLYGWWLVRLSTALIDVICLKRGTTFATVLSMLLMRHERQTQPAGDIFEESGRGRWGGWLPQK